MLVLDFIINIVRFFLSPEIMAAILVSGTYARSIVIGFNEITLKLSFIFIYNCSEIIFNSLVGLPVHMAVDCD